ncbi:hypothetical protein [Burkholderia sp. BCC0419]|uniref:hypothetical protein n=1 Tax=Burkholderia sp. BCC0419 TaxID=486878 RepID=UPI001FC8C179|nr:hypothetical protein [Burkholderia sp. BCC0419]
MKKLTTMKMSRDGVVPPSVQREFVARGLASRNEARRTGEYIEAANVHAELERMLKAARSTKAAD